MDIVFVGPMRGSEDSLWGFGVGFFVGICDMCLLSPTLHSRCDLRVILREWGGKAWVGRGLRKAVRRKRIVTKGRRAFEIHSFSSQACLILLPYSTNGIAACQPD